MPTWKQIQTLIKNDKCNQLRKELIAYPNLVFLADEYFGWTLLMYAAFHEHHECVMILIHAKSDLNQKDNHGETALMLAAKAMNIKDTQFLLSCGAEVSHRTTLGISAFDTAIKMDASVTMLLKRQNYNWFKLFSLYKDQFDEKDLTLYNTCRIPALYA
jgi:ankyrin repeat protein